MSLRSKFWGLAVLSVWLSGCGGAEYALQRGNMAYRQGQSARAVRYYQEALVTPETRAVAAYNLGKISFEQKEFSKAKKFFDEALGLEVEYPLVRVYRAKALKALGRLEEASADLERVRKAARGVSEASLELAKIRAQQGSLEEAVQIVEPALEHPSLLEEAALLKAEWQHELGRLRPAVQTLESLLENHSYHIPTHFLLADYLLELKDYSAAESRYRTGLRMAPSHAPALLGLARSLAGQGRPEEARRYFEVVKKSGAPTHPLVQEADQGLRELGGAP